jgi:glycosyltransferase involved in cell wall biosynthesis
LKILNYFSNRNLTILIALQPKPLKKWQLNIIKWLKPNFGFTPSKILSRTWKELGIDHELIPLLTDLDIFQPVKHTFDKKKLREKYGFPADKIIISHMGHLNEGRNLRSLIPLVEKGLKVIVVISSSTPLDALGKNNLREDLTKSGITIIQKYIDNIQEIYQLSDIYIFPVKKVNSSIGLPLSVLEARSCGIPVITTDYGSIYHFLKNDFGGILYSEPDDFVHAYERLEREGFPGRNFNKSGVKELNKKFYDIIYKKIDE